MARYFQTLRIGSLGVLLVLILAGCDGSSGPPAPPVKIAGVFNLTGSGASAGTAMEKAVALAIKEQNAKGGIRGQAVQYTAYDGGSEPEKTRLVTADAINQGAMALVGYASTRMALTAAPLLDHAVLPLVSVGATNPQVVKDYPEQVFLAAFADNVQAAVGAEFLYNDLKARRVGILTDVGDPHSLGMTAYFQARWHELVPGGVVFTDTYQLKDTEFSAQIAHIRAVQPPLDALLVAAANSTDAPPVVLALRTGGVALPILGSDAFGGATTVHVIAGQPMSDVYYTTHSAWPPPAGGPLHDFAVAYEQEYGVAPLNVFVALAYDGARLVLDAASRAPETTPLAIRTALEGTRDFPGITGSLTFGPPPTGHIPSKAETIIAVRAGQPTVVKVATPQQVPVP
jgi:branched-chain amino acid transport system substrate-binding protein